MSKLSKMVRGWIVFSALWLLVSIAISLEESNPLITIVILDFPLILGWGIWWVRQGD